MNAHFKSRHTNSNSTGKEEGSSSTGGEFEVPSSYYSINIFFFKLLKQEKKNLPKKVGIKRSERWYEELHQATLPAHQATATEKKSFVQWHVVEVSVSKVRNIENH